MFPDPYVVVIETTTGSEVVIQLLTVMMRGFNEKKQCLFPSKILNNYDIVSHIYIYIWIRIIVSFRKMKEKWKHIGI